MAHSLILILFSLVLVVGASKQTLSAGETVGFRILSSGGLSYKVESMNRDDSLCITVGPQYCRRMIGDCYCYPELSSPRFYDGSCNNSGRWILPMTAYWTEDTVLFLFITNNNLFSSSVVFYTYNNSNIDRSPSPIPAPSKSATPIYPPMPTGPLPPSPTPTPTPTPTHPPMPTGPWPPSPSPWA